MNKNTLWAHHRYLRVSRIHIQICYSNKAENLSRQSDMSLPRAALHRHGRPYPTALMISRMDKAYGAISCNINLRGKGEAPHICLERKRSYRAVAAQG